MVAGNKSGFENPQKNEAMKYLNILRSWGGGGERFLFVYSHLLIYIS